MLTNAITHSIHNQQSSTNLGSLDRASKGSLSPSLSPEGSVARYATTPSKRVHGCLINMAIMYFHCYMYSSFVPRPHHYLIWWPGTDCACTKYNHLMVTLYTKITELYTSASFFTSSCCKLHYVLLMLHFTHALTICTRLLDFRVRAWGRGFMYVISHIVLRLHFFQQLFTPGFYRPA